MRRNFKVRLVYRFASIIKNCCTNLRHNPVLRLKDKTQGPGRAKIIVTRNRGLHCLLRFFKYCALLTCAVSELILKKI